MSELNATTDDFAPADAPPAQETPNSETPRWGTDAPRGGKAVFARALKDGARVPLFFGQTFIQSLRDLGYNSTTSALCEHVDNAVEAGATEIRVYFHQTGKQPRQRIDALVYDNGQGMAPNTLKVAMAFGGSMRFDNRTGIGRYGMGMKAAALNMARSVDVYSWQEPGAYYSMTLDVDEIGRKRDNMVELDDPQMSDALPSAVADILTQPMAYPKNAGEQHLLAGRGADLDEALGKSGSVVYMPNCDRLSYSTAKTLAEHATKEMGRIYRRFLDKGVRLYVNNRPVEAFDPTYWMTSARHIRVEGLTETRSALVDSWTVRIPITDGSPNTAEVRVRMYQLPVHAWASLPRDTLKNKLHVFDDHYVSYIRNEREVDIGAEPRLRINKHQTNAWLRVEVEFTAEADEAFGVAANKQGVRLKQFVANAILEHDDGRFTRSFNDMRKLVHDKQYKAAAADQAGQTSEAERHATEMDAIQTVALPTPPTDTPEQQATLEANIRGLAVNLRQDGETDDQAYARVRGSKYLTDFRPQEYAPFYDTEHRFGKVILRLNTAHPFYQKVWQPLGELAKKAVLVNSAGEDDGAGEVAGVSRRALNGLQLLFLSLARAQAQMLGGDGDGEHAQVFRNLRKAWSDVLETQLLRDGV